MTFPSTAEIRDLALSIVAKNPEGIERRAVLNELATQYPEKSAKALEGAIWNLNELFPEKIRKTDRGVFAPIGKSNKESTAEYSVKDKPFVPHASFKEAHFYSLFANYLQMELDEVVAVAPLGGAVLKTRFGTPDVVGTYKPLASHLIKFDIEIVSAEIKIDSSAPVVAFGQAVAYRLFSTKTYIAMPRPSSSDKGRLESLCMLFGVGLVYFDLAETPKFTIHTRAQRFSPDMFYVNEFADALKHHNPKAFQDLF